MNPGDEHCTSMIIQRLTQIIFINIMFYKNIERFIFITYYSILLRVYKIKNKIHVFNILNKIYNAL